MKPTHNSPRLFGIVPAAGQSRRMGQPKLLMPLGGETVMDCVLHAWTSSVVDHVLVVTRNSDAALQRTCRRWPVELVSRSTDPRDMKQSIQYGLQHVMECYSPQDIDRWMVAPADLPGLNKELINQIAAAATTCDSVVAPQFGHHQGHPVLLPWRLAGEVFQLAADEGIDRILAAQKIVYVEFPSEARLQDIDTPEDYRRLV